MEERFRRFSDSLRSRSPLIPFALLAGAIVLFIAFVLVVTGNRSEGEATGGFFSEPIPAILLLAAGAAVIASGAIALIDLLARRLTTRPGRWAFRLAVVNCLLQPLMGVAYVLATLLGFDLEQGWGQPIVPFWMAIGLVAAVLGILAPETRRRGTLVIPLMIGAFALTFAIGEITVPH